MVVNFALVLNELSYLCKILLIPLEDQVKATEDGGVEVHQQSVTRSSAGVKKQMTMLTDMLVHVILIPTLKKQTFLETMDNSLLLVVIVDACCCGTVNRLI